MTNKTFQFTGHLSEGSFVRNGVVQIPKFEVIRNPSPYMPICFGQMTLRTSELPPNISGVIYMVL